MSALPTAGADGPADAECWLLVADAVMRGLCHALSNRVATVSAVASVIGPGLGAEDQEMFAALATEVRRLERVLHLLRLMPRTAPGGDPVRTADVLPTVLAAHEHHPDLRDVPCSLECAAGLPPVPVPESALSHAALALLTAGKQVVSDHGAGSVRVRCGGDARGVALRVEALPGAPIPGAAYRVPPAVPVPPAVALRAARWSLGTTAFELRELGADAAGGYLAAYELALPADPTAAKR